MAREEVTLSKTVTMFLEPQQVRVVATVGDPWSIVGAGDFDRDDNPEGTADILWHNSLTNETKIWFMHHEQQFKAANVTDKDGTDIRVGLPWSIVGVGVFGVNGNTGILWHNAETHETKIWFMTHNIVNSSANLRGREGDILVKDPWRIMGSGNFEL